MQAAACTVCLVMRSKRDIGGVEVGVVAVLLIFYVLKVSPSLHNRVAQSMTVWQNLKNKMAKFQSFQYHLKKKKIVWHSYIINCVGFGLN